MALWLAERVVEKLQNFCLEFTYEVTPDPLLCLAVVRVCHEKDLLIPTGSIQRCLIDAVHVCGYLTNTFLSWCVLCCTPTSCLCDLLWVPMLRECLSVSLIKHCNSNLAL